MPLRVPSATTRLCSSLANHRRLGPRLAALAAGRGLTVAAWAAIGLGAILSAAGARAAQPPTEAADVVVEEADVVVETEEGVVVEAADDEAAASFTALPVAPQRDADGQVFFQRRSTEAFSDPDQPGNLELKYYFELGQSPPQSPPAGPTITRLEKNQPEADVGPLEARLPLEALSGRQAGWGVARWIDYETKPVPKLLAILLSPAGDEPAQLLVEKASPTESAAMVDQIVASRACPQVPADGTVAPLATWDRSTAVGPQSLFYSRTLAVVVAVNGRYAVDFFSEKLHPESDRRVWLTPVGHPWGRPAEIDFRAIRLRRPSGAITPQVVLAVTYAGTEKPRTIGLDYPLCTPPLFVQMRKAAAARGGGSRGRSSTDLAQMLGEELLQEFECRMVNAVQK